MPPNSEDDVDRSGSVVPRVVLDTNILVAAAYAADSASRKLTDACLRGELRAFSSTAVAGEYARILPRAIRRDGYRARLVRLLQITRLVEIDEQDHFFPEDPADSKFLATAVAASATLVTNDRPLLQLDPYRGVRILRPREFSW